VYALLTARRTGLNYAAPRRITDIVHRGGTMDRALQIIYVEDESDIRIVGTLALEANAAFRVRAYDNGADAVRGALESPPDLVLSDMLMEGLDGEQTLAALKARPETAAVPVIFLTSLVEAADVARYQKLGAIGVIAKPFDPRTLATKVLAMLLAHHAA
jgi:CheY-like chemotaxis protein